jgi:hypothetical protein
MLGTLEVELGFMYSVFFTWKCDSHGDKKPSSINTLPAKAMLKSGTRKQPFNCAHSKQN